VLRVGLHPRGLAPLIINLGQWRTYLLEQLERQVAITGNDELVALLEEIAGYPAPADGHDPVSNTRTREGANRWLGEHGILAPLRIRAPDGGELLFFGMIATFGTPAEVTTSELTIEMLFPADPATAEALENLPRR